MNKYGIEKQLYMLVYTQKLTKESNSYCLGFSVFLFLLFLIGTYPGDFLSSGMQKKLTMLTAGISLLLILVRLLWEQYKKSKIAGVFEVVATYLNSALVIFLGGWVCDISFADTVVVTLMIIAFFLAFFFVGAWYESKNIKDKKLMAYMFYAVIAISAILAFLYVLTDVEVFVRIEEIFLGFLISIKVIPYIFIMNFPVKGGFKLSFYGGLKMYDLGGLRIDRCQAI